MSLRSDTLNTLFVQFLLLGTGVVTNIVVARTLGPEGKGLISFLGYALFVAVNLGGLGLHAAAIQQIGKRRFAPERVAAAQILLSLILGVVCIAGMALILPLYRERMGLGPAILFPFLPLIALTLLNLNLTGILFGLGRIRQANLLRMVTPVVWALGSVVALALLRADRQTGTLVWIGAQAVGPLVTLLWVVSTVRPRFHELRACMRDALRFGSEAYLANLVWTLLLRIDVMLMGYLSGPREVGIYSVAVLLGEMLWYLSRSLTTALYPRIAGGTRDEAMRLTHRAARTAFWAVALSALALVPLVGLIIRLTFGPEFLPSVRPFLLLLPGIALGAIAAPLSLYFTQFRGRPRINALTSAIGLIVNLGLNLYLIPRYGAPGAALASSISYGLVSLLLLAFFGREPGFRLDLILRPRAEDLTLVQELSRSVWGTLHGRRARPRS